MTPYLIGGLGVLLGVVAALWQRLELISLRGKHTLLEKKHADLQATHDQIVAATTDTLKRKDAVIVEMQKRETEVAATVVEMFKDPANQDDLLDNLNSQFEDTVVMPMPQPPEEK